MDIKWNIVISVIKCIVLFMVVGLVVFWFMFYGYDDWVFVICGIVDNFGIVVMECK